MAKITEYKKVNLVTAGLGFTVTLEPTAKDPDNGGAAKEGFQEVEEGIDTMGPAAPAKTKTLKSAEPGKKSADKSTKTPSQKKAIKTSQVSGNYKSKGKQKTAIYDGPPIEGKLTTFPIKGGKIGSKFGMRVHPVTGKQKHHNGVDIGAAQGTPILAADDGKVVVAGPIQGFGTHAVYITHKSGLTTVYGHGSAHHVHVGQEVKSGEHIADVGHEGVGTGDHLHFEVISNFGKAGQKHLNPEEFFVNKNSGTDKQPEVASKPPKGGAKMI